MSDESPSDRTMTGVSLYVLAFAVALVRVFFRASQQLAVVNFLWIRVPINSCGFSLESLAR